MGFLLTASVSSEAARVEAFLQGLRDLGYEEGGNILIDWRSAEGRSDQLPRLAGELISFGVDVIISGGATSTAAAQAATTTIPIVMCWDNDPVGNGFVASLARPGGNITGLSSQSPDTSGKRLEPLRDVVPRLARVAVLGTSANNPGTAQTLRETELAAAALKVELRYLDVPGPEALESVFREVGTWHSDAFVVMQSPVFPPLRTRIVEFSARNRLPAVYAFSEFVAEGGLMSYGVSISDLYRRAATYVDKIIKGAKPAGLPVEQPTKFDFVVNLKTAHILGLSIPRSVLELATEVIQ